MGQVPNQNALIDILRLWAQQTPEGQEAYVFGSYARGEADSDSDIDVAIKASAGNWASLASTWESQLTDSLA
jgi:predicted nucleotidyltransferase